MDAYIKENYVLQRLTHVLHALKPSSIAQLDTMISVKYLFEHWQNSKDSEDTDSILFQACCVEHQAVVLAHFIEEFFKAWPFDHGKLILSSFYLQL